jgi:uncharacterized membrane protein YfbV (UPF0208 family)
MRAYDNDLTNAKICADKASPTPQTLGGMGAQLAQAARVPIREQLEKNFYSKSEQQQRTGRALDILSRHPEFEEYLELAELLQSVLYR